MERVKLHGGPWDGRVIERRWSGTPEMQVALRDDDASGWARYSVHLYQLGSHDADGLWHYHYDSAKPGTVRGPAIEDTGR